MEQSRIDIHSKYKKYNSATDFLLPALDFDKKVISYDTLRELGFIGIFLFDKTENRKEFYPNCLLIVLNPSISFYKSHWDKFLDVMKEKIVEEYIEYSYCLYGFWVRIPKKYGSNLRGLFRKGKFSKFPANLHPHLRENDIRKICKLDAEYRKQLEKKLGYEEGDFIGMELAAIPQEESYVFTL